MSSSLLSEFFSLIIGYSLWILAWCAIGGVGVWLLRRSRPAGMAVLAASALSLLRVAIGISIILVVRVGVEAQWWDWEAYAAGATVRGFIRVVLGLCIDGALLAAVFSWRNGPAAEATPAGAPIPDSPYSVG